MGWGEGMGRGGTERTSYFGLGGQIARSKVFISFSIKDICDWSSSFKQTNWLEHLCLSIKISLVQNRHVYYSWCFIVYFPFHLTVPTTSKSTGWGDKSYISTLLLLTQTFQDVFWLQKGTNQGSRRKDTESKVPDFFLILKTGSSFGLYYCIPSFQSKMEWVWQSAIHTKSQLLTHLK